MGKVCKNTGENVEKQTFSFQTHYVYSTHHVYLITSQSS